MRALQRHVQHATYVEGGDPTLVVPMLAQFLELVIHEMSG